MRGQNGAFASLLGTRPRATVPLMRIRRELREEQDMVIDLRERLRPYTEKAEQPVDDKPSRPRRREPLRAAAHEPRHLVR